MFSNGYFSHADTAPLSNRLRSTAEAVLLDLAPRPDLRRLERKFWRRWYRKWLPALDLSFYQRRKYPWLAFHCWTEFSRENAYQTVGYLAGQPRIHSVLDFGAGIGLTTAQLALLLPRTTVHYFNLHGPQHDVAVEIFRRLKLRNVVVDDTPTDADAVVALEVFEHLREPLPMLRHLLQRARVYVDASSFSVDGIGHFPTYVADGDELPRESMKRRFNDEIRQTGFVNYRDLLSEAVYHRRPTIYCRRPRVRLEAG